MELKTKIFKRSKNAWENEETALADVVAVQSVQSKHLRAMHTDTHFVWTGDFDKETNFPIFRIAMADVNAADEAVQLAMEYLDTFEGNLAPNHSETEYIFTKVRE